MLHYTWTVKIRLPSAYTHSGLAGATQWVSIYYHLDDKSWTKCCEKYKHKMWMLSFRRFPSPWWNKSLNIKPKINIIQCIIEVQNTYQSLIYPTFVEYLYEKHYARHWVDKKNSTLSLPSRKITARSTTSQTVFYTRSNSPNHFGHWTLFSRLVFFRATWEILVSIHKWYKIQVKEIYLGYSQKSPWIIHISIERLNDG